MTPSDLAAQCANSINFWTQGGGPAEQATISIVLPKGWRAPPKFPRRALLCENNRGERVYVLSAVKVLAWLAGNGLVIVEAKVANASASADRPSSAVNLDPSDDKREA